MIYQLFSNQFKRLPSGHVQIDGLFEKYGIIIKKQDNGTWLIRGTGNKKPF